MSLLLVRGHWDAERDAVSRAAAQLLASLREEGHEYGVATHAGLVNRNGVAGEVPAEAQRQARRRSVRATCTLYATVLRELRRAGGDLVVVTLDDPLSAPVVTRVLRLLARRRSVQVSWVMDLSHTERALLGEGSPGARALSWLKGVVERRSHAVADHVVTLGACMQQRLAPSPPARRRGHRHSVVPIWQPDLTGAARPVRDGRPLRVLYSGHATHRHPLAAVAEAARRLDGVLPVEFHFVAWGPQVEHLRRFAADHALGNVHFRERVGTEREILESGDVHLVALDPATTGTCVPSKTYAAMMVGRPVIYLGSPEGQAAVDVRTAAAGEVIDADDADGLVAALRRMVPAQVRAALGAAGRAHYEQEHTVGIGTKRWTALLATLLPAAGGTAAAEPRAVPAGPSEHRSGVA